MQNIITDLIEWKNEKIKGTFKCSICGHDSFVLILQGKHPFTNSNLGFYRCENCGHTFAYPFDCPDYHEGYLQWYGDFYVQQGAGIDFMIRPLVLLDKKPKSFLDVGSGIGFVVDYMEKVIGCESIGIEPGLQGERNKNILSITLHTDYLENLQNLKGRKFDIIYSSEVIEHIVSPLDFLELLSEYLNEDGVLILTTPNADYILSYEDYSTLLGVLSLGFHVNLFTEKSIRMLLEKFGFRSIVVQRPNKHRLLIYASRGKLEIKDIEENEFRIKFYIPYLENLFNREDSLIVQGAGWRLFKELVNLGEYKKANEVWERLSEEIKKRYAEEVLNNPEITFNRIKNLVNLEDFGKVAPYFIGGLYYYYGIILLNHYADYHKASSFFRYAFEIFIKSISLGKEYYVESADLLWVAKFHEGLAYRYAGDTEKAYEVYSFILENQAIENTFHIKPQDFIISRASQEISLLVPLAKGGKDVENC